MSTSDTHQQSLADAGYETRPSMLERGSYIPWASHFRRYLNRKRENIKWLNKTIDEGPYEFRIFTPFEIEAPRMQKEEDLRGDDLKHYEAEIEAMNLILISILNDIYNSVDACTTAKAMWQRVEHLMRGTVQNKVDRETRLNNENGIIFPKVTINTKFLNCLQPGWLKKRIFKKRNKKKAKHKQIQAWEGKDQEKSEAKVLRGEFARVNHYQGDAVQNNSEDPLTSAMILLARDITQSKILGMMAEIYDDHMFKRKSLRVTIEKGHYACNCPKLRVRDLKYFMEQMLLAKQDEAGVILTDEQNDFLFADASRMEEIKELSANIYLMARIQPTNIYSDARPSYNSAFLSKESQSQFIHDRDVIQDLEQQRDKLELSVVELKRQSVELQKTQSILNCKISENEDQYHDTVLDLEVRAKKNEDIVLKMGNSLQGMFMLGPKSMSFYDSKVKHGLGYTNPYTLKVISQNPKLYDASCLDDSKIPMHVRDTKDILDDATKSQIKMKNKISISSVRRPTHRDSSFKNSVLSNTKNSSEKVEVSDRTNKKSNVASKNVESNKKIITNDDIINALIAKNVLCVSCAKNVLIPCHDNCLAKYNLNVHLKVRRALFTTSRIVKSKFEDPTLVVSKTSFSVKIVQSKSLDTTPVVSKTKIDVVTPLSAKHKIVQIVMWIVDSGFSTHMTGDRSLLKNFVEKFMGTVRFGNDQFIAITGYVDYVKGNIIVCHVYYIEGLGHNLFSVEQLYDGDLEVAFCSKTCYVQNLEEDDLLTGDHESNLYTISISNISIFEMDASSPVCLMSKATLIKSWLWHRRLLHLNFGTINDFTKHDLVDDLLKFKYGHNRALVEAACIMFIFSRLPEFLWAEAVSTACFTQNRSIIHKRYNKTPYELLYGRNPNVDYFHVFGSLFYLTNDRDDLGKMKPKADIGIFIGYSETSRGFQIYNRRTKKIKETIRIKFDELTTVAFEHDSLEPISQ
ncbi:integrase, catalytic region, zinc finger, CCHC-type containing protein [Tanacetum coccineum]|uniref:Integrase, catalytic region, zinc finger, CCHC-type containing protein n=1 Tax=Tanacetum coccineum TaxID=301880 RepID=A0ABQ5FYK0_9ASTR